LTLIRTTGRRPVVSISPEPESKTDIPPIASLRGVADRMSNSPDAFTVNVGYLIDYIATQHELPVTCAECNDDDIRRESTPCLMYERALSAAFAWLLKVVDER
jgi:hypothetical protein